MGDEKPRRRSGDQPLAKLLQWIPIAVLAGGLVGTWYVTQWRLDRLEHDNDKVVEFRELQVQVLGRLGRIERDIGRVERDIRELKALAYQPRTELDALDKFSPTGAEE